MNKPPPRCREDAQRQQPRKILLRFPRVEEVVGLSRSEVDRRVAIGEFPAPIKLGLRAVAWDADLIQAYIRKKLAGSRLAAQPAPVRPQPACDPASPRRRVRPPAAKGRAPNRKELRQ
jgi:prophage regulatory protein